MNLLYPSLLWAFVAILIPIIIHFFTLLRLKKVEFSTVKFIRRLETSSIRKVKIQQLLLLLLRILAITALVIMFARPVTKGLTQGWLAEDQRTKLIAVIDNSASMNAKIDNETLLERSKFGLISLLPVFHDKTDLTIVQTCPQKTIYHGSPHSPNIKQLINRIEASYEFDNVWNLIDSLITKPTFDEFVKECIVFSDFMYKPDSTFLDKDFQDDWKFYFINPGEIYDNVGIHSVSSINRLKTPNELIKLNVGVSNSGNLSRPNVPVELFFDNNRVGQVVAEFKSGSKKEFIFQAYPGKKGIVDAVMTLPEDDYNADNNWYVSMPVMEEIKCGIIASAQDELTILEMLFRSIDPTSQFLFIESRLQPKINRLFIDEFDVVVIHNPEIISDEAIGILDSYLKNGGGLIWFQGNKSIDSFNVNLTTHIGFPFVKELKKIENGFFKIDYERSDSDLISNMQVRNIHKELPEVFSYMVTNSNPKHKIHLLLNTGDPFFLEFSRGTGNIFYFSSLLDLRWNDLPVRGFLVPLFYRILILAGTDQINTSPVEVGSTKWISVSQNYIHRSWELESPSGQKTLIVPDFNREGILISNTSELGVYRVFSDGLLFTSFPTRLNQNEYLNDSLLKEDFNQFISSNNIKLLYMNKSLEDVFLKIRRGKALWKTFLLIALTILLLESLIGRPNLSQIKS
tara:strand:+ start:74 stop:2128 length:2055 start_codon:yes stop_codon:yes gene_type:complete